jgi:hypothetical protein
MMLLTEHMTSAHTEMVVQIVDKFGDIADAAECCANANEVAVDISRLLQELRVIETRTKIIRSLLLKLEEETSNE